MFYGSIIHIKADKQVELRVMPGNPPIWEYKHGPKKYFSSAQNGDFGVPLIAALRTLTLLVTFRDFVDLYYGPAKSAPDSVILEQIQNETRIEVAVLFDSKRIAVKYDTNSGLVTIKPRPAVILGPSEFDVFVRLLDDWLQSLLLVV